MPLKRKGPNRLLPFNVNKLSAAYESFDADHEMMSFLQRKIVQPVKNAMTCMYTTNSDEYKSNYQLDHPQRSWR